MHQAPTRDLCFLCFPYHRVHSGDFIALTRKATRPYKHILFLPCSLPRDIEIRSNPSISPFASGSSHLKEMATPTFTAEQLEKCSSKDKIYLAIHGKVYDVTQFKDEHPGGEDILLDVAGKDASEEFDDAGHSEEAIEQLKELYVGEYKG